VKRLLYAAGTAFIAWGFYGLFTAARHPHPKPWLTFFIGANVLTDLVVAPVTILIGLLVARFVGARLRPYVISGLVVSGVVLLVGFPLARGYGRRSDNPSILPLDYTRGLVITLALVWAGVAAVALVRERLRRVPGAGGERGRTTPVAPAAP
jgi:hypothetical protein